MSWACIVSLIGHCVLLWRGRGEHDFYLTQFVWFPGSLLFPVSVLSAFFGSRYLACGLFGWVVMGLAVFRLG